MSASTRSPLSLLGVAVALAAAATGSSSAEAASTDSYLRRAPGHRKLVRALNEEMRIPDEYIVTYTPPAYAAASTTGSSAQEAPVMIPAARIASVAVADGAIIKHEFRWGIHGFSASNVTAAGLKALLDNPLVQFVEENQRIELYAEQLHAPWGLDRIDQGEDDELDGVYHYDANGHGVDVWVVDTGLRVDHVEFGDRAECSFDIVEREGKGQCDDLNRHGTHVGAVIAGYGSGVAKRAHVKGVKVLNRYGGGSWDDVIFGLDHIIENHDRDRPTIVNMSFGGPRVVAVDEAVKNVRKQGILVVVAAGNNGEDACNFSPAGSRKAISVGAVTQNDRRSNYSNYGDCVDIFAPGDNIVSAYSDKVTAFGELTGTSAAAPFVAGVAAIYWGRNPHLSSKEVSKAILDSAIRGKVQDDERRTSNNRLVSTKYLFTSHNQTCVVAGQYCASNNQCCSGKCKSSANVCKTAVEDDANSTTLPPEDLDDGTSI